MKRILWKTTGLAGGALLLALLICAGGNTAFAGKPTPPPPPPPPADPAIVYELDFDIRVMNADGTNDGLVLANASTLWQGFPVGWSPDGTEIVFNGEPAVGGSGRGLYTVDVYGQNLTFLTPLNSAGSNFPMSWSPVEVPGTGSQWIVFTDYDGTQNDLYAVRPDGSDRVNLTMTPGLRQNEYNPAWSRGADRIVARVDSPTRLYVYTVGVDSYGLPMLVGAPQDVSPRNPDGSPRLDINLGLTCPNWARTKDEIAFGYSVNVKGVWIYSIGIIDITLDPTDPDYLRAIPVNSYSPPRPRWSPDDTRILFHDDGGTRSKRFLSIIDTDGTNKTSIKSVGGYYFWGFDWRRF